MIIFPFSTALTLAKPPLTTYATAFLCVLIFQFQLGSSLTESLMYYPESWNPLKMITASIAHGSWTHLIGNLVFFLAFAPALEALIGSTIKYISVMLFISFVVGVSYSISILIGSSESIPTLGLSGVVMGMMGLSAFMMPRAKIKVFGWFIFFWKIFYVPAWVIAVIYIGLDSWEMFTSNDYGGINVVAHVTGGLAGYLYGWLWLKERKEETKKELEAEIEEMKLQKKHGKSPSMSYRRRNEIAEQKVIKENQREQDHFMGKLYKSVSTHRDSDAINMLLDRYDIFQTAIGQYEELFDRVKQWGPSRTQLCLGRLIIDILNEERRYGRALFYIEKCQQISPKFILANLSQTVFYAKMAIETDKMDVAKNLIAEPEKRYGSMINVKLCHELIALINSDIPSMNNKQN